MYPWCRGCCWCVLQLEKLVLLLACLQLEMLVLLLVFLKLEVCPLGVYPWCSSS